MLIISNLHRKSQTLLESGVGPGNFCKISMLCNYEVLKKQDPTLQDVNQSYATCFTKMTAEQVPLSEAFGVLSLTAPAVVRIGTLPTAMPHTTKFERIIELEPGDMLKIEGPGSKKSFSITVESGSVFFMSD